MVLKIKDRLEEHNSIPLQSPLGLILTEPRVTMLTPAIPPPQSCDTFVYVVQGSGTLFGKNSDRPSDEHHEGENRDQLTKIGHIYYLDLTHDIVLTSFVSTSFISHQNTTDAAQRS